MATISDIAKMSGVSRGTVDRVIHNRGRVSKANEERVKAVIDELKYHPNIFARGLSLSKKFCLAVIIPQSSKGVRFWELPVSGIEKAQKELAGYQVNVEYFYYDYFTDMAAQDVCRTFLQQLARFDGVIILPAPAELTEEFINDIPGGFPYVFIDTHPPNTNCLAYIGTSSYKSGILSGRLMELLIRKPGLIAILHQLPRNYHTDDRIRGFQDFYKNGSANRLQVFAADRASQPNVFFDLTAEIIEAESDLRGIFVPSSTANEVADSLQVLGLSGQIHLLGYDLTEENVESLQEGRIDFLISQRPEMQGYHAVYALYRHIVLNERTQRAVSIPLDIVTRENVEFFIDHL